MAFFLAAGIFAGVQLEQRQDIETQQPIAEAPLRVSVGRFQRTELLD